MLKGETRPTLDRNIYISEPTTRISGVAASPEIDQSLQGSRVMSIKIALTYMKKRDHDALGECRAAWLQNRRIQPERRIFSF